MLLSPAEYANVSPDPYVRPAHPGVLIIPPTTSEQVENRQQKQHEKDISLYGETIFLENALKKQISDAIDELYLEEFAQSHD